jgi:hypothetical protein
MSEDNIPPEPKLATVRHIDERRFVKIAEKSYLAIVDEYECLKIKFFNQVELTTEESVRFVTLCKYLVNNGHNDSFKLSCQLLYDKYMVKK